MALHSHRHHHHANNIFADEDNASHSIFHQNALALEQIATQNMCALERQVTHIKQRCMSASHSPSHSLPSSVRDVLTPSGHRHEFISNLRQHAVTMREGSVGLQGKPQSSMASGKDILEQILELMVSLQRGMDELLAKSGVEPKMQSPMVQAVHSGELEEHPQRLAFPLRGIEVVVQSAVREELISFQRTMAGDLEELCSFQRNLYEDFIGQLKQTPHGTPSAQPHSNYTSKKPYKKRSPLGHPLEKVNDNHLAAIGLDRNNSALELDFKAENTVTTVQSLQTEPPLMEEKTGFHESILTRKKTVRVVPDSYETKFHATLEQDAEIDTSHVTLKDNSAMGNVFSYDTTVDRPPYCVEVYYKKDSIFTRITCSNAFQNTTLLVVLLNAIWLAVDSDYNHASTLYAADWIFQVVSQFFGIYFTLELAIRFLAFKRARDCFRDGWFRFDTFLVATMIIDIWVIAPIAYSLADGKAPGIPTQPLRLLRLFKLSRMARLMKTFPELVIMIKGLAAAVRAMASSLFLIAVMTYTWAILLHGLLGKENHFNGKLFDITGHSFDTITRCMWTLLMAGTLMLDNTAPLMTRMFFSGDATFVAAGIAFVVFMFLSALLVLQMLIGVMCDVVQTVNDARRDAEAVGLVKQELLGDLQKVANTGGKIAKHDLMDALSTHHSKALLKKLNINRLFLMNMAGLLFPTDDFEVPIRSVLELMIMCKSDNSATVQIISHALCFLSSEIADLHTYTVHHLHMLTGYLPGDEIYGRMSRQSTHSTVSAEMAAELAE